MGVFKYIDGTTEHGARRTAMRTEAAALENGQVMRAMLVEMQQLNQQVAWLTQALAQALNERAHVDR
jgi:LmbE family N-acetylglucosaminyl deacetylase